MQNTFLEPYFSATLIKDYIREQPHGLRRFQIYNLFRFLVAADEQFGNAAYFLRQISDASLSEASWSVIADYLEEDFYFSPSLRADTSDAVLLYYTIWLIDNNDNQRDRIFHALFSHFCPKILRLDLSDPAAPIPVSTGNDAEFFGSLTIVACGIPAQLPLYLPAFADIYWESLHYTCEDFVLYNFMDEYFEISNCRNNPKFQKLIDALCTATLHAQDITLEECVTSEGLQHLFHPSSQFAGLYRYGVLTFSEGENLEYACKKMHHLLEYAVACELRQNLFDFHLEEDRIITLDNWETNLKWYHVQYDSAYAQAISSFYTATLSQKMLKKQFYENLERL